jgi:uncharacterized membrane protein
MAGAAVLAALLVVFHVVFLDVPAGLALVVALPGFALSDLLFHHRQRSGIERVVVAVALSLAVVVLGGIGVYGVGLRLTRVSWAVLTAGVTVLAVGLDYLREVRAARNGTAAVDGVARRAVYAANTELVPVRQVARRLAPLALCAVLLVGSGILAVHVAENHPGPAWTGLSMTGGPLPTSTVATPGVTRDVYLEVDCEENGPTVYRMVIEGPTGFTQNVAVSLPPGDKYSKTFKVPYPGRITVNLFKGDQTTVYRTVFLSDPDQ